MPDNFGGPGVPCHAYIDNTKPREAPPRATKFDPYVPGSGPNPYIPPCPADGYDPIRGPRGTIAR